MTEFSAQARAFVLQTQQRLEAVMRQSVLDLLEEANTPVAKGGNMPVDTGTLRASLSVTINDPSDRVLFQGDSKPAEDIAVSIAAFEAGDTLYGTWTANYAAFVEYGTEGRAPRYFLTQAAGSWQSIVDRNATELARRLNV